MKRRTLALLLSLALLFTLGAQNARAEAPEDGALLTKSRVYQEQFTDVPADSWYHDYIALGYEYGLFDGRGDGFAPDAEITLAELLTLSARLYAVWSGETIPAAPGAWYAAYVNYLDERALLDPALPAAYNVPATRDQLAAVFACSLPAECYDAPNAALVDEAYASGYFITDVGADTAFRDQILLLYAWGLLGGVDPSGSYLPDKTTTRAEAAAIVMRMVLPSLRLVFDWAVPKAPLAPASLAALVSAPEQVNTAPSFEDKDAIRALVRQMLASDTNVIDLEYAKPITPSDANTLARVFSDAVKSWCEQMYNSVQCQYYLNSGQVRLTFSASCCLAEANASLAGSGSDAVKDAAVERLNTLREETFRRAAEVREQLWSDGLLRSDMSQYEMAQVYFQWLCDNCDYDKKGAQSSDSVCHIAYSALTNGLAVCDGYTGAYNLLLKLEGIECYALPNENHIWTVAVLDGKEYHIDVTWGDQEGWIDWSFFGMDAARSEQVHNK
ncbi:MAG: surface layer protein [Ruminococcaceae bacterium]|nr:surface layer protein [Oscillospiraceae bacterium]